MIGPYASIVPAGDDDHSWVRPESAPCPNCRCCSARLCERGRGHVFGCAGICQPGDEHIVRACPCSSAATEGTEAHRAAQERAAKRAEQGR